LTLTALQNAGDAVIFLGVSDFKFGLVGVPPNRAFTFWYASWRLISGLRSLSIQERFAMAVADAHATGPEPRGLDFLCGDQSPEMREGHAKDHRRVPKAPD
jgi:hypothetical protein